MPSKNLWGGAVKAVESSLQVSLLFYSELIKSRSQS